MTERKNITKLIKAIIILLLILIIGCVDKSASINFCNDKGLSYYGRATATSCDIKCINLTSGEFSYFEGKCDVIIKRG